MKLLKIAVNAKGHVMQNVNNAYRICIQLLNEGFTG